MKTMLLLQSVLVVAELKKKSSNNETTLTSYIPGSIPKSLTGVLLLIVWYVLVLKILSKFLAFYSDKAQVWCRPVIFCFSENVDKCYIKGKIYICVISFGVSFFSDVHARQRVALHALLKYCMLVFEVLSNHLFWELCSSFGKIWASNENVIPYDH